MARAARRSRRKAASLGLLTLGLTGCASMQNPPGGPADFTPPTLLSVTPDSGTINPGLDGEMRFQFDEVIDERSGGGLENLFGFSPRVKDLRIRWHRQSIGIEPRGGWTPNTVYQVTLDSTVADLRQNRLGVNRTIIFTTGGEIPVTALSGVVIDWEGARAGARALVEAVRLPDSLVYVARADSVGEFLFNSIPTGTYSVYAVLDANNNDRFERREPFDSVIIELDSTAAGVFWTVPHDTTGPRIQTVTRLDSITFSVAFNQSLQPGSIDPTTVGVKLLPDSLPIEVATVTLQSTFDSITAGTRAVADSARRDSIAAADTSAADSTDVQPVPADTVSRARDELEPLLPELPDTSTAMRLLGERPPLEKKWVVTVATPLAPGARYVVSAGATNINGVFAESRSVLIIPAPQPEQIPENDVEGQAEEQPAAVQEPPDSS